MFSLNELNALKMTRQQSPDEINKIYAELKGICFNSKALQIFIHVRKKWIMGCRKMKRLSSSVFRHAWHEVKLHDQYGSFLMLSYASSLVIKTMYFPQKTAIAIYVSEDTLSVINTQSQTINLKTMQHNHYSRIRYQHRTQFYSLLRA